jgi:hypothetical protein
MIRFIAKNKGSNICPLAVTVTATVTRTIEFVKIWTVTVCAPLASIVVFSNMQKNIGVWSILMIKNWSWLPPNNFGCICLIQSLALFCTAAMLSWDWWVWTRCTILCAAIKCWTAWFVDLVILCQNFISSWLAFIITIRMDIAIPCSRCSQINARRSSSISCRQDLWPWWIVATPVFTVLEVHGCMWATPQTVLFVTFSNEVGKHPPPLR